MTTIAEDLAAPAVTVRHHARVLPGLPYPLGATWDGCGVNFALFTENATRVDLCLFDRSGRKQMEVVPLPEHTDGVWHGYLPDGRPGLLYGYRVHGPYDPQNGHRFNANKLLIDPYARALSGVFRWADAHCGYRVGSPKADMSFDRRDNARYLPKCRVVDTAFTWGLSPKPAVPWDRTIVYEAHVRGMTMQRPDVPTSLRGTFSGLAAPGVIDHLRSIGVTAVELLPIHAIMDDRFLTAQGLRNYWGYSTLNFFAPEPRYMSNGSLMEFKAMVNQLHEAGIEVLLDVVYNHTCEGSELGPTLSFRGIDNAAYYRLLPGNKRYYINETGCGNTLNITHPRVLQMVMDSLRYWVTEMGVDGFRFDLASTLGREADGFDPKSGFFDAIRQDPVLSRAKLIAEPWDIGPGGYQLGRYPSGWSEWNDRYRDCIRRYWRGDHGMLPELAARLSGSADLFDHHGRRSHASINFVACHDGFTTADLVSYDRKHNQANGEANTDGHDGNHSSNHGVEGPTANPAIKAVRARQIRNMLATVFLSQGTPMLLAGDEVGNSQSGNNNAYCQDNPISWIDWESAPDEGRALTAFVGRLAELRAAHPVLRRPRFLHGQDQSRFATEDIVWITPSGSHKTETEWRDHFARSVGVILAGDAGHYPDPDGTPAVDDVLLILLNAHTESVRFTVPSLPGGKSWACLLDTAWDGPVAEMPPVRVRPGGSHHRADRSLAVFKLEPAADSPEAGHGK
ncbi:glycogen debranching protein GlgX [Fodinicurvata sp. EGI_FJ10296]|uniref:glycogen debranching protein GlgX n=1 Tax=Fodinicurvata sp. EGI_FJ10296 TaxID=3231908 RepID=UPI0034569115